MYISSYSLFNYVPCFWESAAHPGMQQAWLGLKTQLEWCVTTVSVWCPSSHWPAHAAPSSHTCPQLSFAKLAHWKSVRNKITEQFSHFYVWNITYRTRDPPLSLSWRVQMVSPKISCHMVKTFVNFSSHAFSCFCVNRLSISASPGSFLHFVY